ncbi:DUF2076 domain-containing protein [Pseudorhodoplanes sp.]|uniref:DUF2076 domain-containing protein n=1 Tax=Pseudorhodoplanes sp. TaxID=1934341 RepID=UPI00391BA5D2
MTPQERKLVEDLFDRLATLEYKPREADAENVIRAGLRRAPNATYALVQTVLLQEEALRRANERIQELEAAADEPEQSGGFLGAMRDTVFGGGNARGSVPQIGGDRSGERPGDRPMGLPAGLQRPGDQYHAQGGAPYQQQTEPARAGMGGSFLGTAAAAAAGVIGGTMLMNALKGAFGGGEAKAQGIGDMSGQQASANPWGEAAGGGDLARQAGIDNIGRPGGDGARASAYEPAHEPMDDGEMMPDDDGGFFDFDADI